jgi:hypothetical protein
VPSRIAVVGGSGSGKTTVAQRLAELHDLPYVELDALHWGPNWTPCPRDEFRARVESAISGDAWVVDGGYYGMLGDLVLERADLVVWLDLPLRVTLPRLWRPHTVPEARANGALGRQPRNLARRSLQSQLALRLHAADPPREEAALRAAPEPLPDGEAPDRARDRGLARRRLAGRLPELALDSLHRVILTHESQPLRSQP